jgi:hypothetical protein
MEYLVATLKKKRERELIRPAWEDIHNTSLTGRRFPCDV